MTKTLDQWQIDGGDRCIARGNISLSALRARGPRSWSLEDRVLRITSGAPVTRREIRLAGMFALAWFAMDAFWFISTLNHWFGL
jgi:hypothetical protein